MSIPIRRQSGGSADSPPIALTWTVHQNDKVTIPTAPGRYFYSTLLADGTPIRGELDVITVDGQLMARVPEDLGGDPGDVIALEWFSGEWDVLPPADVPAHPDVGLPPTFH